jgi:hypothetical protein
MLRARVLTAALAISTLSLLPGCLTLFSKTEVLRGDEQPRPVRFENAQAAEEFEKARKERSDYVGGTYFGVPFVTIYEKDRRLSENAHFNYCVAQCDTDQDGVITLAEAQIFAKRKD